LNGQWLTNQGQSFIFTWNGKYAAKYERTATMQDQRKIVIQMGVSQEHISECVSIVSQLLGNTVKPDLIFVNLSQKDFPKRMDSLPDDVVRMFQTTPCVKVVWDYGT
jgi:hypothetical protein